MGSKSSSAASTNVTDQRIGATDQAVVVSHGSSLTMIDPGITTVMKQTSGDMSKTAKAAITGNSEVARQAIVAVDEVNNRSLSFAGDALDTVLEFAYDSGSAAYGMVDTANKSLRDISSEAMAAVERAQRQDSTVVMQDIVKYGALAAAAVAVAKVIK